MRPARAGDRSHALLRRRSTSMNNMQSPRGFVALMTVIIITAILLVLMCTMEFWSFFSRFDTLDAERMSASELLAESCVSRAVQHLAIDGSYSPAVGGECVS